MAGVAALPGRYLFVRLPPSASGGLRRLTLCEVMLAGVVVVVVMVMVVIVVVVVVVVMGWGGGGGGLIWGWTRALV